MTDPLIGVVLAAGSGTRMRSRTPKTLHVAAGRPLVAWVLDAVTEAGARPVVVLSKASEAGSALLSDQTQIAIQDQPRGTGDAVRAALDAVNESRGEALVVCGDAPLIRARTLRLLLDARRDRSAVVAILTAEIGTDNDYGRVVRDASGDVVRIVEARLAEEAERDIGEANIGAYAVDLGWLRTAIPRLRPNATGEIFLTDIVAVAVGEGRRVSAYRLTDRDEAWSVNDRFELAAVERLLVERIRERHMRAGVTFHDPSSSFVGPEVQIAPDAVIERGSILEGKTRIGSGSRIGPYSVLRDSSVAENCTVEMSVLEEATLEDECRIGPFGHLRPGAYLERGVKMGNYGEVKNARLGAGTQMHHFSYIGDASVGKRVNIAAGTITMNVTASRARARTEIGDDAFIGCGSLLRAPVRVGLRAITGGGSVVTRDVPDDAVVVGVPARELRRETTQAPGRVGGGGRLE